MDARVGSAAQQAAEGTVEVRDAVGIFSRTGIR